MIEIVIPGKPLPYAAPMVTRRGFAYDRKHKEKKRLRMEVGRQFLDKKPLEGPIRVDIIFYMAVPESTSKKMKERMISQEIRHLKKPDVDNCIKWTLDLVKGTIIKDDNQVCELRARKLYSTNPETIIDFYQL